MLPSFPGTFPSAPGVFLFAVEFGVNILETTRGVILCTAISGPLMLVTTNLANISLSDDNDWLGSLHRVSMDLAVVGVLGGAWVLLLHALAKPGATYARRYICAMAASVLLFSVAIQTCRTEAGKTAATVRFIAIWGGASGGRERHPVRRYG